MKRRLEAWILRIVREELRRVDKADAAYIRKFWEEHPLGKHD